EPPAAKPVVQKARSEYGLTLQELTPELARKHELKETQGALVTAVEKGSQAEQDGIRAGDLIRELGLRRPGEEPSLLRFPIRNLDDFAGAFRKVRKGKNLLVLILRKRRAFYMVLHSPK
ncbi:MAG: PDZ domain-containing protein, partial [Nitrospinota bacterium]